MPTITYTLDDGFGTAGKRLRLDWQPLSPQGVTGRLIVAGPPRKIFSIVGVETTVEDVAATTWKISNLGAINSHQPVIVDVPEGGGDVTNLIKAAIGIPPQAPVTTVATAAAAAAEAAIDGLDIVTKTDADNSYAPAELADEVVKTVNGTPPVAGNVEVVAELPDGAVEAELAALGGVVTGSDPRIQALTGPTRVNLAKNPALGANATGWVVWAGTGGAATSGRVADGDGWAWRVTWTTGTSSINGEGGYGRTNVDEILVTPGDVMSISAAAEVNRIQRLRAVVTFYDAANAQAGSIVYGPSQSVAANTRTRLGAANMTVPGGATHATIRISSVSGTDASNWQAGDALLVTKALPERSTTIGSYFDGSTTGAAWSGTANDSTSSMESVKTPAPVENPSFTGSASLNGIALANVNNVATESAKALRPRASGWTTGTAYAAFDETYFAGIDFLCLSAHTSGTFLTDLAAGRWRILGPRNLSIATTPPSAVQDYVNTMWSRAHPELHPFPVAVSYLASGFSLTTELGAGFVEHVWDAPGVPVRTLGLLSTSVSAASTTFQGNRSNGSGPRQPFDLELIVDVPDEESGSLVISVHDTVTDPKPGVQVWVDGRPTSVNMVRDASPSTTTMRGVLIDGLGAGRHIIRVTLQSMDWRSVAVPAGVTVTKTTDVRTKVIIEGDSWIEGGTEASPHATWPHAIPPTLARLFGPSVEVFYAGQGGTGYTTTPGAPKTAFGNADRVGPIGEIAPDYVLIVGTQNDDANHASVQAAATAAFSAIATAAPDSEVILIGPASTRYDVSGNRRDSTNALKAAAAAASNVIGGYVISPHLENWMSGNGRIGSPDGLGIADFAMHSDGQHPTVFGAAYVARRAMEHIVWLFLRQGRFGPYGFTL
ncbi:hypothetical protein [Gordonia hongkongensis]|uniref:hypothetical protein n=1 Tax=Gordonia hongkongensis TaxID=1701090 RepID=UPI003D75FE8D